MRRREGERSGERWGEGREIDWFLQKSPSVTKIIWNALPIQGPGTKSISPLTRLLVNHRAPTGTLGCPVGTQNWTCLKPSLSSHSTNYSSSCIPCLAHQTTNHWRPCPGSPPRLPPATSFPKKKIANWPKETCPPSTNTHLFLHFPPRPWDLQIPCTNACLKPASRPCVSPFLRWSSWKQTKLPACVVLGQG